MDTEIFLPDGTPVDDEEKDFLLAAYEQQKPNMSFPAFARKLFAETCGTPTCGAVVVADDDLDNRVDSVNAIAPPGVDMEDAASDDNGGTASTMAPEPRDIFELVIATNHAADNLSRALDERESKDIPVIDLDIHASASCQAVWIPEDPISVPVLERLSLDSEDAPAQLGTNVIPKAQVDRHVQLFTGRSLAALYTHPADDDASASAAAGASTTPNFLDMLLQDDTTPPAAAPSVSFKAPEAMGIIGAYARVSMPVLMSGGENGSFAAELRATVAGLAEGTVETSRRDVIGDEHDSGFLDGSAMARLQCAPDTDDEKVAFMAAAMTLADALVYNPEIKLSLLPTAFISKMDRAWGAFVAREIKAVPSLYTPAPVAERAAVTFTPIVNTLMTVGKGDGIGDLVSNYQVLGAMATVIMRASFVAFKDRGNARPYNAWFMQRMKEIMGKGAPSKGVATPMLGSDSLLTQTTLDGKVTKGLTIVMNRARAETNEDTLRRTATNGTYEFMNRFVKRWGVSKVGDKNFDRDTAGLFYSAACGTLLMNRLYGMAEEFPSLKAVRDDYLSALNAVTLQLGQ